MLGYIYEMYNSYVAKKSQFYYLSLIKENDDSFSIHGLWPQYSETSYPVYCRPVEFSIEALNPIMDKLNKYWYSDRESNSKFWKHEYEKHGSCMFSEVSEFDYFNLVLNLYKEAIQLNLPNKYYNQETGACLIPVSLDFKLKK